MHEIKSSRHTLNTIVGVFAGGRETSSDRKKYACVMMHVSEDIAKVQEQDLNTVSFSKRDVISIMARENDLMVIKV